MKTVKSTIETLGRSEVSAILDLTPPQVSKVLADEQFPASWWHGIFVLATMQRKRYSKNHRLNSDLFAWRDYNG